MNVALSAVQNNTKEGPIYPNAGVSLLNAEGFMCKLGDVNGVRSALLPTTVTDPAIFVCLKPAAAGQPTTVQCPSTGENFRTIAKGSGSTGSLLSLADMVAVPADAGKLRAVPAPTGTSTTYLVLAIAEEDFVDGQYVLCRLFVTSITH